MGKRGPKKTKFGQQKNLYLSNEVIRKANQLSSNFTALVESLILKEWGEKNSI